jgi:hypothetical protein
MIRALKVTMIVWAIFHILLGLMLIVAPYQVANLFSFGEIADHVVYIAALLGACYIIVPVWIIMAARDPLKNISWVRFLISLSGLDLIVQLSALFQGAVNFSQVGMGIITTAVFTAALLAFYPWHKAPSSQ